MRLSIGKHYAGGLAVAVAIVFSASCGGGSGSSSFRVMQASPDEGSVNVLIDGQMQGTDIPYAGNTGYLPVGSGSRHIQVEPVNSSTPIIDENITIGSTTETTMIVANYSANVTGVVLTDGNTAPTTGDIEIRVVNASPGIGSADIYIVPSGSSLTTVAPVVSSLGFESATDYQTLVAGTYEVFLTAPGTKNAYLSSGQITLTSGQIRTLVAINGPTGGYSTVTLADLD